MGGNPGKSFDDETGSNASFEEVSKSIKETPTELVKRSKTAGKDVKSHKIEGELPEVLYVLHYLGFGNKVIESESPSFIVLSTNAIPCG